MLATGMRVLPRRAWWERERDLYRSLYGASIRTEEDGTLVLPRLPGETLASVLTDPERDASARTRAIEWAAVALADLHRRGETHGDAMAENVLVDTEEEGARWFDFETLHDAPRPMAWRRADDLRALLTTCILRVPREKRAETLRTVLDAYADEGVTRLVATGFASVWQRPLAFHLGQAPLSFQEWWELARSLQRRVAAPRMEA
jgi:hypothetical protein